MKNNDEITVEEMNASKRLLTLPGSVMTLVVFARFITGRSSSQQVFNFFIGSALWNVIVEMAAQKIMNENS